MNPVGTGSAHLNSTQTVKTHTATHSEPKKVEVDPNFSLVEHDKTSDTVSLSKQGQALMKTLEHIDETGTLSLPKEKSLSDKVESFTYGALGLDRPDEINEKAEEDSSYSAGKYLKAAATIGGILLAVV
ncbi:hypothetical protein [Vibrio palustris]|uniref:Uncharacterized protein n=1 Tax=Vibrio palustris TaxID=1918946 RepID=A0A1R4B1L8_9VIBR|nr:hypothetical protein [Vibrio palustris]SJL82803.1 hypothetical protein VPAL9027_00743 [Vibrio palustris]